MFQRSTSVWKFLAVEVAVKIQDLLEPNEDHPPYEYYPEAQAIVKSMKNHTPGNVVLIQECIAETLSNSLEFEYKAENFKTIAEFIETRLNYIHKYLS